MTYKETIIPTEDHHSIELPKEMYGKKVEVIAYEVSADDADGLPPPKNMSEEDFWENIPFNPDFPSLEEIRKVAWPKRQW